MQSMLSPPERTTIAELLFGEASQAGRSPRPPFTCALSGRTYSAAEVQIRIDGLARSLASRLGFSPTSGNELDKVFAVFSVNHLDYLTACWAAHRIGCAVAPINENYTRAEVVHQLRTTNAKVLFTSPTLVEDAQQAAEEAGIPKSHVFIFSPSNPHSVAPTPQSADLLTLDFLVWEGLSGKYPALSPVGWDEGGETDKVAFLCTSSGTSGMPKTVRLSHRGIIANLLQANAFEREWRTEEREWVLGLLPQSHVFGLIFTCHYSIFQGDGVIVLPSFDLEKMLHTISQYRLQRLYMIPPLIISILKAPHLLSRYDLSCVHTVMVGAAPLNAETTQRVHELLPTWRILQVYGATEAGVVMATSTPLDLVSGSCGNLWPGFEARLLDSAGQEITAYDTPGELLVKSPSIMLGYLNNPDATAEVLLDGGWMRTGDMVLTKKGAMGRDHLFVIDRMKEMIKVRGMQVAPAELEALLRKHRCVEDACVIPLPDESAGELPRAYVLRAKTEESESLSEAALEDELHDMVGAQMSASKQLRGGIEFIDALPKSVSGKVLRKVLKARAREHASYLAQRKSQLLQKRTSTKGVGFVAKVFEFDSDDEEEGE